MFKEKYFRRLIWHIFVKVKCLYLFMKVLDGYKRSTSECTIQYLYNAFLRLQNLIKPSEKT